MFKSQLKCIFDLKIAKGKNEGGKRDQFSLMATICTVIWYSDMAEELNAATAGCWPVRGCVTKNKLVDLSSMKCMQDKMFA